MDDGTVKLLDFGIAKIAASTMTNSGNVLGSAAYMAPEQVSGREIDGRADVFAAGVVLYELLARRKPFEGEAPTAVMMKIIKEDPPPIRNFAPDIPAVARERDQQGAAEGSRQAVHARRRLRCGTAADPAGARAHVRDDEGGESREQRNGLRADADDDSAAARHDGAAATRRPTPAARIRASPRRVLHRAPCSSRTRRRPAISSPPGWRWPRSSSPRCSGRSCSCRSPAPPGRRAVGPLRARPPDRASPP